MNGTVRPEVLVLGATGQVGAGIVGALLEAGSPVLAVGRDPAKLVKLAGHFSDEPGLDVLAGSVASEDEAQWLAATLRGRQRPLRAVIASLAGPVERGRLLDRPADVLARTLEHNLLPHLTAARHLLPLLAGREPAAQYLLIGPPCSERPWAGYGHESVAAAAQRMLAQALHAEARGVGVRLQMLAVDHPVRTPANEGHACAEWPTALAVGRTAVDLLARGGLPLRPVVHFGANHAPPPVTTLYSDFSSSSYPQRLSS
ncbi:SDR family NAD(P)-dependent oxidoreductase [Chiayiivirga flava]|uniref:NAD(P)-dependent dehydrogenase (Short-subunit alcohol dehydrogenase family) n=1 Tax=Chiayiivirga flava TaxID=659595 RepID=A0A7W8G0B7_9GAMM|nr:NAD(P)-dependent dehydrogenase (short-subunit alcohol dehydrogenase family) [Chiayiivirga flava]